MVDDDDKLAKLDESNFDEFIRDNKRVVIDFWATWCSPCMAMNPVVQSLAEKYHGKVAFGKINVEENGAIASRFGIQAIPVFLFMENGNVVRMEKGMIQETKFQEHVEETFDI